MKVYSLQNGNTEHNVQQYIQFMQFYNIINLTLYKHVWTDILVYLQLMYNAAL